MKKKKGDFDLRKKLLLPSDDLLRNFHSYGVPDPELKLLFEQHLLKVPIFEVSGAKIILHVDRKLRRIYRVDGRRLLDDLSLELAYFYAEKKFEKEFPFDAYKNRIACVLNDLSNCKELLINSGVKEKAYLEVWNKISKWSERALKKYISNFIPVKRVELVKSLYPYFKKYTNLSDEGIYYCIAHILKSLEVEKGNVEQMIKRIKRDYLRKGKPAKNKGVRHQPYDPRFFEP